MHGDAQTHLPLIYVLIWRVHAIIYQPAQHAASHMLTCNPPAVLQTVATGLARDNKVVLREPQKAGKSLVYLTDTVLLPDDQLNDIPVPKPTQ